MTANWHEMTKSYVTLVQPR